MGYFNMYESCDCCRQRPPDQPSPRWSPHRREAQRWNQEWEENVDIYTNKNRLLDMVFHSCISFCLTHIIWLKFCRCYLKCETVNLFANVYCYTTWSGSKLLPKGAAFLIVYKKNFANLNVVETIENLRRYWLLINKNKYDKVHVAFKRMWTLLVKGSKL